MPDVDTSRILRAYLFAEAKHKGQTRESGVPYIEHPLAVAHILADLQMGPNTLVAGLLHDTLEDTKTTREELEREFGEEVAKLVEGVSKLKWPRQVFDPHQAAAQRREEVRKVAENLRKMLLAVAKDLRVMVIKLADRLHNMQTLDAVAPEKQRRVATETLQIYAPLAHRLGIWQIKSKLDDLAFKYLHPQEYEELSLRVVQTQERQQEINGLVAMLKDRILQHGIQAEVKGRPKHLWSIYQKMLKHELDLDQIYDLLAMRVITESENDCYQVLGIVHDLWMPVPALFYDYIAKPKPNGYRSLHTKVIGPNGQPLEIQIRTREMHHIAEFGVASHWRYKEGDERPVDVPRIERFQQQLQDLTNLRNNAEFLNEVMGDIASDQVFVFTPRGDVIDLPVGSTPIDFAYRIHTDLGNHCYGARVNGRLVPISHPLTSGDIVQVLTRPSAQPSRDWLAFAKSSGARSKIRAFLRRTRREEYAARGRELLEKESERNGMNRVFLNEHLPTVVAMVPQTSIDELYAAIGEGLVSVHSVIQKLRALQPDAPTGKEPFDTVAPLPEMRSIQVVGGTDVLTKRANCCEPLPGDDLLGYVSRGRGMIIHRSVCGNIRNYQQTEPERVQTIQWQPAQATSYPVTIRIEMTDRLGLLADISTFLGDARINIESALIRTLPDRTALIEMRVQVQHAQQLNAVFQRILSLGDVLAVYRREPKCKPPPKPPRNPKEPIK